MASPWDMTMDIPAATAAAAAASIAILPLPLSINLSILRHRQLFFEGRLSEAADIAKHAAAAAPSTIPLWWG